MQALYARIWTHVRQNLSSYIVIALGAVIQLLLITRSFDFILTNLLPDDAFYYFQIARQIVEGNGSTFDGTEPTNGYHPLWLVVLLPFFSVFSVGGTFDVTPIYAVLGVSFLINIATALIVLRLVAKLTVNHLARTIAMIVWALNPFILFESLNGLETSLALFFLALFSLTALHAVAHNQTRDYVIVGVVAGLMVLARLDMALYAVAFAVWLLFHCGLKEGMTRAFQTGAVALLVASPWFIWNFNTFGMLLTSASNGNVIINHALVVQDNGASLFQSIKAVFYMLVYHGTAVLERTGMSWFIFALLGASAALLASGERALSLHRKEFPLLLALFGGCVALFLINAGIRFTGRTWYFVSVHLFIVLTSAWILGYFFEHTVRPRLLAVFLIIVLSGSFFLGWYQEIRDQHALQRKMYEMAEYMNERLPVGTRVGVFNAGVQGYFSQVEVVNLDGLVNNSAYEAIRDRRLWSYIQEKDIAYISDFDLYLSYRYKPFLDTPDIYTHLKEAHRIVFGVDRRGNDSITLYQVVSLEVR